MTTYFHVSPIDHPIGTVLQPGKQGEHYKRYVQDGTVAPQTHSDAYSLTWEAVLETARRLIDNTLPSRMKCIYATTDRSTAVTFRDRFRPNAHIFKVKVSDGTPTFRGNLDSITSGKPGVPFLDIWVETAIKYWTQVPDKATEILIGGPVTIEKKV